MSVIWIAIRCLLSGLMIFAGVMHFARSGFFLKIMPPYIPYHLELVYLSGVIEIVLGIMLLVPRLSRIAGWGLVALYIAVFPANIYVYQHQEIIPASPNVHFLRLLLQGLLIWWAYSYTKVGNRNDFERGRTG